MIKIILLLLFSCKTSSKGAISQENQWTGLENDLKKLEGRNSDQDPNFPVKTVYFDYDSHFLNSEFERILEQNVQILKKNPSWTFQLEGHCDKRGSEQYNLFLGERRALSVKKFLIKKGIDGSRLKTISYGKSYLLRMGDSEEDHGKNRRVNFSATSL